VVVVFFSLLLVRSAVHAYNNMKLHEAAKQDPTFQSLVQSVVGAPEPSGFEVTVPAGWSRLEAPRDPLLAPRDQLAVPAGPNSAQLDLMGREGTEHDRLAVIRGRTPGLLDTTADLPDPVVDTALEDIGFGGPAAGLVPGSTRRVEVAQATGWQFDFTATHPDGTELRGRELVFSRDSTRYELRLVTEPASFRAAAPALAAVAKSWRWDQGATP
jgi:hypothetical protein